MPNDFAAGTTARAADVNANFAALETAVNDNDARITANTTAIGTNAAAITALSSALQAQAGVVVVDGNDAEIGVLLNIDDDNQNVDVLTTESYVLDDLSLGSGQVGGFASSLYFTTANCTGTAYTFLPSGFVTAAYNVGGTAVLHYVAKTSVAVANLVVSSESSQTGCVSYPQPMNVPFPGWPALPNDPTITGVASQSYKTPITIRRSR